MLRLKEKPVEKKKDKKRASTDKEDRGRAFNDFFDLGVAAE